MKNKSICILATLIAICMVYIRFSEEVIEYNNYFVFDNDMKYVDSDVIDEVIKDDIVVENNDIIDKAIVSTLIIEDNVDLKEVAPVIENSEEEVIVDEENIVPESENVLENNNEILYGTMSGYGPDCVGCSGYVSYGKYVGSGNIYYDDSEYGNVRIVAGDKKFKFGTIVRINDSMLAVVLDRGGAIGIGKKFLFDLLYDSEETANKNGVSYNTKFEILRNGF